jgi:hypothetical protein
VAVATESALAALEHVWRALAPLGHPMAVMGGVSLAAWHHIRATRDVDILIGVDRAGIDPVLEVLGARGCRPKRSPPIISVGDHHFVQMLYTPPGELYDIQLDLLLAESELQKSAMARRVASSVPGLAGMVHVLNCDDLVLFKLLAGRMIDRADAAMLLRENRDAIDYEYLRDWVAKLNLQDELEQIWSEAFPGHSLPSAD